MAVEDKLEDLQKEVVRLQVQVENLKDEDKKLALDIKENEELSNKRFEKFEELFNKRFNDTEATLKEIKEVVLMSKGSYKTLAIIAGVITAVITVVEIIVKLIKT